MKTAKEYNISMQIKTITPIMAASILLNHKNYRNSSKGRVKTYSSLMEYGDWLLSIIIFDEEGHLIDGQHRLKAVIDSGVQQTFVCLSGWPREEIVSIDNGQNRSRDQVAKSERGMKSGTKKLALASGIEYVTVRTPAALTNLQSLKLYDKYEDVVESVWNTQSGAFKAAVHGIAFARAILCHPDRRDDILSSLRMMCDLDFSAPEMSGLRLYCQWASMKGFTKGGHGARFEVYMRCSRAIKSFLTGEVIEKLYRPTVDPFPWIPERTQK